MILFSNNFLSIVFIDSSRASSLCLIFLTCMNHFLIKNLLARNLFLSSQFSNNDLIKTRIFLNSIPSLNCSIPTIVNLFLIFSAISLNFNQFLNLDFNWNKAVLLTNISYLLDKSFQFCLILAFLKASIVHLAILFPQASLVISLALSFHCNNFLFK